MKQIKITILMIALIFMAVGASAAGGRAVYAKESRRSKEYVIAQDGSGDFATIQEGVDKAADGDTLIIREGTYYEEVLVMNKEINLVGADKNLCILKYDTASYRHVPLTIAAGSVSNLTICGVDSGAQPVCLTQEEIARIDAELVGDSWERQKDYKGYAVHVDQNFLYGRQLSFKNCRIVSENSHCVGIGTRGESEISFEDCDFISTGEGSCIYLHDPTTPEVSGRAEFRMTNCRMASSVSPYVMNLQSLMPENNLIALTFQNVQVNSINAGSVKSDGTAGQYIAVYNESGLSGEGWCGLEGYYLTAESRGNTLAEMNVYEQID